MILGDLSLILKHVLKLEFISAKNLFFESVDSYDDLNWDDPLPFLGEVFMLFVEFDKRFEF